MADSLRRRMMMGQSGGGDYSKMYLTFKALEDGTFKFTRSRVYYSLDGGSTWVSLTAATNTPTITAGSEIMWKTSGNRGDSTYGIGTFSSTGQFEAYGNVASMQEADNFADTNYTRVNYQFMRLFYNATNLMSVENVVLPAKYLTNYCYRNMFYGCTNITKAPELPATTLENYAYTTMFSGCTSLAYIKCLATDISASNALTAWTRGVAATGTFVKAASMTSWPSGENGIPSGWTVIDAT